MVVSLKSWQESPWVKSLKPILAKKYHKLNPYTKQKLVLLISTSSNNINQIKRIKSIKTICRNKRVKMKTLSRSWKWLKRPLKTILKLGADANAWLAPFARWPSARSVMQWTTWGRIFLRSRSRAQRVRRPTRSAAIGTDICGTVSAIAVSSVKLLKTRSKDWPTLTKIPPSPSLPSQIERIYLVGNPALV